MNENKLDSEKPEEAESEPEVPASPVAADVAKAKEKLPAISEEDENDARANKLSADERNAFEALLEMHAKPQGATPTSEAPQEAHAVLKSLIAKPTITEQAQDDEEAASSTPQEVTADAALAAAEKSPAQEVETEPVLDESTLKREQTWEHSEHNYFARLPPDVPAKEVDEVEPMEEESALEEIEKADSERTDSASENDFIEVEVYVPLEVSMDHNYCQPPPPIRIEATPVKEEVVEEPPVAPPEPEPSPSPVKVEKTKKKKKKELADITNNLKSKGNRELASLFSPPSPPKPKVKFTPRTLEEERKLAYEFLMYGKW